MNTVRGLFFLAFLALLCYCDENDVECTLPKHMKAYFFNTGDTLLYKNSNCKTDTFIVSVYSKSSSTCLEWEEPDYDEEDDYGYYSCTRCKSRLHYEEYTVSILPVNRDRLTDTIANGDRGFSSVRIYSRCHMNSSSTTVSTQYTKEITSQTPTYDVYNVPIYYILNYHDVVIYFNYKYGMLGYELQNGDYYELQVE